jgi:GxxExxY protein
VKKQRSNCQTAIAAAANRVYRELGPGFVEQVYRDAMAVELRLLGLRYEIERNIEVFYRGARVGLHRLDFIVDGNLVVELKAAGKISEHNFAQTSAYLRTTDLKTALVINFPSPEKEDGPEIEVVNARRGRKRTQKGTSKRKPAKKRKALPKTRRAPKPKQEPLSERVWDDVSRRYVAPPPVQAVITPAEPELPQEPSTDDTHRA